MKLPQFVELYIYNGRWGVPTTVNLAEVKKIAPDKNWTRITYKDGKEDLVTEGYRETMEKIKP